MVICFFPFSAAGQPRSEERCDKRIVTLPADEVVNEDYFAWGYVVEILGTVHGDVYAAEGEIRMAGTVDGDLLAAGGKVRMEGKVSQNARIAGGEVKIGRASCRERV